MKLAKEMGPGHTIVTTLCDLGTRYQSKMYNVKFLRQKNLPYPEWLDEGATATHELGIPNVFV